MFDNVDENMKAHVNPLNRSYHNSITFDEMVPMNHEPQTLIIITKKKGKDGKILMKLRIMQSYTVAVVDPNEK